MQDTVDTPCCSVSRLGPVVLLDVVRRMTVGYVDEVRAALVPARAEGEAEILVRVRAGVPVPSQDVRAAFVSFLREERGRVRAIHIALEGHGFWAATMTALVANVARAVPLGPPMRVHASIAEATAAVQALTVPSASGLLDRAAIARAFDRVG